MSSEDDDNETVDAESVEAEAAAAPVPRDEVAETRSSEARRKVRDQMQADIEAFLKAGGRIEQVAPNTSAQEGSYTATAGNEVS